MRLVVCLSLLALAGCASPPSGSPQALHAVPALDFDASMSGADTFVLFLDKPSDVAFTLRIEAATGAFLRLVGPAGCEHEVPVAAGHPWASAASTPETVSCPGVPAGAHVLHLEVDVGRAQGRLEVDVGQLVDG